MAEWAPNSLIPYAIASLIYSLYIICLARNAKKYEKKDNAEEEEEEKPKRKPRRKAAEEAEPETTEPPKSKRAKK